MPPEVSGIAASRVREGIFYAHADHGNAAELHAFERTGTYDGVHPVSGVTNGDWEDIAAGPCPDGSPCLVLGDIGDNDFVRQTIAVVLLPEPGGAGEEIRPIGVLEAAYPDGPHDAETLLVHPCDGAIYVITKEIPAGVYRFPPEAGKGVVTLEKVASLDVARWIDDQGVVMGAGLTGGDWDEHGERLVVRSNLAVWEWTTDPADPDGHWDVVPRLHQNIDEPLGEGVAFAADAAVVTVSEGTPMVGHVLVCDQVVEPEQICTFEPIYDTPGCGCGHAPTGGAAWLVALLTGLRRRRADSLGVEHSA